MPARCCCCCCCCCCSCCFFPIKSSASSSLWLFNLIICHCHLYDCRFSSTLREDAVICMRQWSFLHFACVVDDAKCIVVTRVSVCVSVCLSAAVCPRYCTDPDVTWGSGRGCSLIVHYWADLQSVHGLRCYGNITRTLVTSLRPPHDVTSCCEREMLASALYSLYA